MKLEIEYLSPEELVPYEDNARVHGPESVAGIASSIIRGVKKKKGER